MMELIMLLPTPLEGYAPEASKDVWAQTISFLESNLK